MNSDFQHAAYLATRHALEESRKEAQRLLADAFPETRIDTVVPAIDQALGLCNEAARVMRQMQQSNSKEKVVAELRRRCPGYSDETYEAAAVDALADYIR